MNWWQQKQKGVKHITLRIAFSMLDRLGGKVQTLLTEHAAEF